MRDAWGMGMLRDELFALYAKKVRTGAPIQKSRTELPGYWLTGENGTVTSPLTS